MPPSHWLDEAIAALRKIQGTRDQREAIEQRLVRVQAKIRD